MWRKIIIILLLFCWFESKSQNIKFNILDIDDCTHLIQIESIDSFEYSIQYSIDGIDFIDLFYHKNEIKNQWIIRAYNKNNYYRLIKKESNEYKEVKRINLLCSCRNEV